MDRSLEEIISERPRGDGAGRGSRGPPVARAPRREPGPRDGVRKYRREEQYNDRDRYEDTRANIDNDWVHDRYEEERHDHSYRRPYADEGRQDTRAPPQAGSKIRVDNLHYDLTEDDLRELFERIGPVVSVNILYDRADRSQGTAFVIYRSRDDARAAVSEFDGCNANGQPIRLTQMPSGSSTGPPAAKGSLFDRIQPPVRSLFDRIQRGPEKRAEAGAPRRRRSESPRRSDRLAPADVDRYVPGGRRSRSPIRRRGTPREAGRRPGQKREDPRGPRRPRTDEQGHHLVGGRPRKTAEELDAEMEDYWGSKNGGASANAPADSSNGAAAPAAGDVDMDEVL